MKKRDLMLLAKMKSVIKYAIELDIDYLETFLGYEGDKVLKIITKSERVVELLEKYMTNLDLYYKSEYDVKDAAYKIFVGIEDSSVFKLKKD